MLRKIIGERETNKQVCKSKRTVQDRQGLKYLMIILMNELFTYLLFFKIRLVNFPHEPSRATQPI